jgi:hypothetical protein
MAVRFQQFDSLEVGFDLELPAPGALNSEWFKDKTEVPLDEAASFKAHLRSQKQIFRILNRIIHKRYKARSKISFDLTASDGVTTAVYNEGYKQALRDIARLIPNLDK